MVQRLFNIQRWKLVEMDQVVDFPSPKPRLVRIDVNAPDWAELYYITDDGEALFLALVKGRDTVEFQSSGKFSLAVRGGECWVYSVDGEDISTTVIDPIIFTRVVERRRKSPELVAMEIAMMHNMNKRMEQMQRELTRGQLRRDRAIEAQLAAAAAARSLPPEPEQDAGDESSADVDNEAGG